MSTPIEKIPLQPFKKQVGDECILDFDCEVISEKKCCFKCNYLQNCKYDNLGCCNKYKCPYFPDNEKLAGGL
jgi:hypothetical protein